MTARNPPDTPRLGEGVRRTTPKRQAGRVIRALGRFLLLRVLPRRLLPIVTVVEVVRLLRTARRQRRQRPAGPARSRDRS